MKAPLIINIKGNSLDDGPGIRTVIFFKGCPLSCVWCHNPESKSPAAEISFEKCKCIGCDSCIDKCRAGALSRDNQFFVDRGRCTLCFGCTTVCPANALSRVGMEISRDEIISRVIKDKPFYDTSGGGVTFSGGEATMHMEFISGIMAELKSKGIHILLETCGLFNLNRFRELIIPYIDTIYMDIKLRDALRHKSYCGVDNDVILSNFISLNDLSNQSEFEIIPRIPLIPGITDTDENLSSLAIFLHTYRVKEVRLLPNNPVWHDKCETIGISDPVDEESSLRKWYPQDLLNERKQIFEKVGIKC